MASRTALLNTAAMAVVVAVGALIAATASAMVYKVGDDAVWGPDPDVDYNDWAKDKDFKALDRLEFVYEKDAGYNVVQVNKKEYDSCTAVDGQALEFPDVDGHDSLQFDQAGQYFFMCDTDDNCNRGMKLTVTVSDG